MKRHDSRDFLAMACSALFVLLFVAAIFFGIWVKVYAPCKDIGFLPIKDIPSRCFTIVKTQ